MDVRVNERVGYPLPRNPRATILRLTTAFDGAEHRVPALLILPGRATSIIVGFSGVVLLLVTSPTATRVLININVVRRASLSSVFLCCSPCFILSHLLNGGSLWVHFLSPP
jgi:hypothetical protein